MHQGITDTISLLLPCERELVKGFLKLVRYYNMDHHECKYDTMVAEKKNGTITAMKQFKKFHQQL
jgi:hypothetical protein